MDLAWISLQMSFWISVQISFWILLWISLWCLLQITLQISLKSTGPKRIFNVFELSGVLNRESTAESTSVVRDSIAKRRLEIFTSKLKRYHKFYI